MAGSQRSARCRTSLQEVHDAILRLLARAAGEAGVRSARLRRLSRRPVAGERAEPQCRARRSGARRRRRKNKTIFNLAQPFQGQVLAKDLAEPGLVKLKCDVHAWMSAWIVVRDNPYYAVTGEDGSYRIGDVPPGKYTIVLWHEGLGQVEKQVTVESNRATEVSFPIHR